MTENWMVRFDNDGLAYTNFRWSPIGEWTEAPDWDPSPRCGGGLHGQGPGGFGYSDSGRRFVFLETGDEKVSIVWKGYSVIYENQIKVKRARILAKDKEAWLMLDKTCNGNFPGSIALQEYKHPLPINFETIGGNLFLDNYPYPLPDGLKYVGGTITLINYKHPLPNELTKIGGSLYIFNYDHPLPTGLTSIGDTLNLFDYQHPLPDSLTRIEGNLDLHKYQHLLPDSLSSIGGNIRANLYPHQIPDKLIRKQ